MTLIARPLTAEGFAPYGTVVAAPEATGRWINGATTERFDLVVVERSAAALDGDVCGLSAPASGHWDA